MARRQVRVATRRTHAAAMEEACRRLKVMAEKWPDRAWRMRVEKYPRPGRFHTYWPSRSGWSIVALVPEEES